MRKSITATWKLFAVTILVSAVWIGGMASYATADSPAAAATAEKPRAPVDLSTAIIQVAEKNIPAVVHIEVTMSREVANPLLPFEQDPSQRRFFGVPKMPPKYKQEMAGLGSGMILDPQGHILTNYHVVGSASKIEVVMADGSRHTAKLIGTDPKTDLAVIKITAAGTLPTVTFGDSDRLRVGEWVVAIGAPRGLDKTVTQGIISAKHRRGIMDPMSYEDFLQTDAPINPGNSGGPLLNLYGEVIGVNTVIASASGGSEGIGFTIPSNMAVYVSRALIAHGKVERGWLGISIRNAPAPSTGAQPPKGAQVMDVVKGGPAERAGLKKNDVITRYGDMEITDSSELQNSVAATPAGRDMKLMIFRDGRQQELTARIGKLEESTKLLGVSVKERIGAEVRALTAQEAEKYGLEKPEGVVISRLDPRGVLAKAGLEISDVILAIGDRAIEGVDTFVRLVNALPAGQEIPFTILDHRNGEIGLVGVTLR
ncbi:MAG TPA: trypsin-like peptidase domain-containing protein [Syntrophales bacterium]